MSNQFVVQSEHIGRTIIFQGRRLFCDVLRDERSGKYVGIVIDEEGKGEPIVPNPFGGGIAFSKALYELQAPSYVLSLGDFFSANVLDLREVRDRVLNLLEGYVKLPSATHYKLLTYWIMSSWVHGLLAKKPNLYVTGFFGTGKSVVGQIVRGLARYPCDIINTIKASELWHTGILKGVMIMDETDVVSRKLAQTLRRIHDEGVRMARLTALGGAWEFLTLDISAPIVLIGTHLPRDPALISRGFVIKMHYGIPPLKPIGISTVCESQRLLLAKAIILRWFLYQQTLARVYDELETELHLRMIDIIAPLAAMARLCNDDYSFLIYFAKYSSTCATVMNPSIKATLEVARTLLREGRRFLNLIAVGYDELIRLIVDKARELGLSREQTKYIEQYFLSAAEPCIIDDETEGLCFVIEDLESVTKLYGYGDCVVRIRRGSA